MNKAFIKEVEQGMVGSLNNAQMEMLHNALTHALWGKTVIEENKGAASCLDNAVYLDMFLAAKKVEGCSERSLRYYSFTMRHFFRRMEKCVKQIETSDLRAYLASYEEQNKVGKTTLDNIRRILSSFFSWMEDEDHIIKSPARRIHKIRTGKTIKTAYSDEELERLRDHCKDIRDLAMIDFLASTGVRVGELVRLDIEDLNFDRRECVVLGKGNKERTVYFDARTKLHLLEYIGTRNDENPALFVSLHAPHQRLKISGVEIRLRNIGKSLAIQRVYPHKFRRTLATRAIDKGMPIEQVQVLLGHTKIDTTLQYAMVNQSNVKIAHQKYISG